jgi:kynurenine formamidase/selenocysteine lyase/cysteine desulfurase
MIRNSAPEGEGYFLYHSIGQYPGKAEELAAAMAEFGAAWGACDDDQWGYALKKRERFTDLWRKILNAPKGSVTTTESVTSGLMSIIGALPDRYLKGKRVLIAADCFPSLHFLLSGLAPRFGFTLDTVPLRPGASWVEESDFIDRWGADVGLALLTWVSSTTSARCDLETLVAHGRAMGSLIAVDITQAAGLLPYDVMVPRVDFALSTSLKWMCGTPGAGMIYVSKELIPECRPELRGWFSQNNPFSWDLDRFEYAPDIRRFDHGTPGIVAALASLPALEWHARQDRAALVAHNRELSDRIIAHADELGLPLASPREADQRGGSIMLRLPDTAEAGAVVGALGLERITVDHRSAVMRLSPGAVTEVDEVARAFEIAARVMRTRARRYPGHRPAQQAEPQGGKIMSSTEVLQSLGAMLMQGGVKVVDCSGTLGPETPILRLPEDFARNTPKVEIHKISEYDADGPFFAWNWMVLGEHSGTHFDAPHHWITGKDYPDGYTDTLDVQRLVAPVNVIDCSAESEKDADFLLTADHVKAWEAAHGEIGAGEWVVMRTDWDRRAHDEALFLNEDDKGPHSPGPTPDCIDYLLSKGIVGWGTQCIGTDAGQAGGMSPPYPAHNLLHRDNCFGLASLANLDQLPPKGAILIAAPLKIARGTGSPIRALALVPAG